MTSFRLASSTPASLRVKISIPGRVYDYTFVYAQDTEVDAEAVSILRENSRLVEV